MGKITLNQFLNYKKIKDVKDLITDKQYCQIENLFLFYDTKTIKNRLLNIREFILNGVENNWLGRLRIITNKLKNDVISEYSCKIRYGENWKIKQDMLKEKVRVDKNNFIKKYGKEIGEEKWKERNKKVISYGLNPAVLRYGEEEGKKRWVKTLNQKIKTMSELKKIRPYRNGRTLLEYQQKYGVEDGHKKWEERNKKQSYRFSLQYYIDSYGEEKGVEEWKNYCNSMVKTTQESFIKRYGNITGKDRYEKLIERFKFTQTESYYIEKYGNDKGKIKYQETLISKLSNFKDKYSKISQDLFWYVYENLSEEDKKNCFFYELNEEYGFYVWKNNITVIKVDFKLGNKIIEFDGDYWHSSDEQKEIDKQRDKFLNEKGYFVKRIKECDYKKNKKNIIIECINFLKKQYDEK